MSYFIPQIKLGRPRKFETVEELQNAVNEYFQSCFEEDENGKLWQARPFTVTGLSNALDVDRKTLLRYEKEFEEPFRHTVKKAKNYIEQYNEERLALNKNAVGIIFNLKNNFGWEDSMTSKLIGDKDQDAIQLQNQITFYIPDNKRDSQD